MEIAPPFIVVDMFLLFCSLQLFNVRLAPSPPDWINGACALMLLFFPPSSVIVYVPSPNVNVEVLLKKAPVKPLLRVIVTSFVARISTSVETFIVLVAVKFSVSRILVTEESDNVDDNDSQDATSDSLPSIPFSSI